MASGAQTAGRVGIAVGFAALLGVGVAVVVSRPAAAPPPSSTPPTTLEPPAPKRPRANTRWIAAAGGQTPELNQVSIEQDLALAAETFGPGGTTLFAAGPGRPVVQVLAEPSPSTNDPTAALADLFAPRGGRDATYRAPTLALDGPATEQTVRDALEAATGQSGPPLLLYLGGHGHRGPTDAENGVGLWAHGELTARGLAELIRGTRRPVQIVATTCFSGGLAELAFAEADPDAGPMPDDVCGLFAAPHDLEASGCDPNPDRAAQQGFGLHFLHALRGMTRDGAPADVDFDGDGTIDPREAHAYVRIHSRAFDVPTSTSERWLEAVAPGPGSPKVRVDLPEENAVIAALSRQLGLVDEPERAGLQYTKIESEIEALAEDLAQAQATEDQAWREASAEVLARWPVLDDPWHPEFGAMMATNLDAITEHFAQSERHAGYLRARAEVDRISDAMFDLRAKAAPYERLARALDYRQRARRLAAEGGDGWAHFERLRACERLPAPEG
ncbi:MAG: hypothetical protein AAGA54_15295 [Myxococcota bacterium]